MFREFIVYYVLVNLIEDCITYYLSFVIILLIDDLF